jgi:hypothetical protein
MHAASLPLRGATSFIHSVQRTCPPYCPLPPSSPTAPHCCSPHSPHPHPPRTPPAPTTANIHPPRPLPAGDKFGAEIENHQPQTVHAGQTAAQARYGRSCSDPAARFGERLLGISPFDIDDEPDYCLPESRKLDQGCTRRYELHGNGTHAEFLAVLKALLAREAAYLPAEGYGNRHCSLIKRVTVTLPFDEESPLRHIVLVDDRGDEQGQGEDIGQDGAGTLRASDFGTMLFSETTVDRQRLLQQRLTAGGLAALLAARGGAPTHVPVCIAAALNMEASPLSADVQEAIAARRAWLAAGSPVTGDLRDGCQEAERKLERQFKVWEKGMKRNVVEVLCGALGWVADGAERMQRARQLYQQHFLVVPVYFRAIAEGLEVRDGLAIILERQRTLLAQRAQQEALEQSYETAEAQAAAAAEAVDVSFRVLDGGSTTCQAALGHSDERLAMGMAAAAEKLEAVIEGGQLEQVGADVCAQLAAHIEAQVRPAVAGMLARRQDVRAQVSELLDQTSWDTSEDEGEEGEDYDGSGSYYTAEDLGGSDAGEDEVSELAGGNEEEMADAAAAAAGGQPGQPSQQRQQQQQLDAHFVHPHTAALVRIMRALLPQYDTSAVEGACEAQEDAARLRAVLGAFNTAHREQQRAAQRRGGALAVDAQALFKEGSAAVAGGQERVGLLQLLQHELCFSGALAVELPELQLQGLLEEEGSQGEQGGQDAGGWGQGRGIRGVSC